MSAPGRRDADIGRQTDNMIQSVRHDARFVRTAPRRADETPHVWTLSAAALTLTQRCPTMSAN